MPVSFATTSGRSDQNVTINVTALSASTQYIATINEPSGHTRRIEFTTDGSGAATLQFSPAHGVRGAHTVSVALKNPAPAASGSNTFTGV